MTSVYHLGAPSKYAEKCHVRRSSDVRDNLVKEITNSDSTIYRKRHGACWNLAQVEKYVFLHNC